MSHILAARANFWSYYWVFALAMIFAPASQGWGRLKNLVISIFPMSPSACLCFKSRWSLTFPFLGCWWASSLMQSPTTAKDQRLREVGPAPGHMQVILCPKNSRFGLCQAGCFLWLRGGTWSVLEWRLLWERQGCPGTSCPTPAHKNKLSSQLLLSLPHSQSTSWGRKTQFCLHPWKT